MKCIKFLFQSSIVIALAGCVSQPNQTDDNIPPLKYLAAESMADDGGRGSFPATMIEELTLPTHTIYRPKNLVLATSKTPLPIVVWANGGCSNYGDHYRYMLTEIASHGYMVISTGAIGPASLRWQEWRPSPGKPKTITERGERVAPSLPGMMNVAIDWAITENERSSSQYVNKLDTKNIAVMGSSCGGLQAIVAGADPRVKTVVAWNSGTWKKGLKAPGGGVATKEYLKYLHTSIAYFSGSEIDVAFQNSVDDFDAIDSLPVVHAWRHNTPHEATYKEVGGGEYTRIGLAWLNWQLKGQDDERSVFLGKACKLCEDPTWEIKAKGW